MVRISQLTNPGSGGPISQLTNPGSGGPQPTTLSQIETESNKLSCPENQHRNNEGSCESDLNKNKIVVIVKSSMGISKEILLDIK